MEIRDTIEFFDQQCAVCGSVMAQRRKGRLRRTCSDACRQKLYRLRKQQPAKAKKNESKKAPVILKAGVCPICGKAISQKKRGRLRITCSTRCQKAYWRLMNPKCPICGKRFKLMDSHNNRQYCSEKCAGMVEGLKKKQMRRLKRMAFYQQAAPEWLPRKGSGYRAEKLIKAPGEAAEVLWEREPEPNYEEDILATLAELRREGRYFGSAEEMRAQKEEDAAAEREARAAQRQQAEEERKAEETQKRLHRELFEEEWRWFGRDVEI